MEICDTIVSEDVVQRRANMYHISKDIRAQKSAELVAEGLIQCGKQKLISEIAISELQRSTSVSRSTFYRLFDNILDVLLYQSDLIINELLENMVPSRQKNVQEVVIYFIQAWMDHAEFLEILVKNGYMNILCDVHRQHMDILQKLFRVDLNIDAWTQDYLVNILAEMVPAAMTVWIQHGKRENAQQVYANLKISFEVLGLMYSPEKI